MRAAEMMRRDVVTVPSGASLADAARLMLAHNVNAVPVLAGDGRVVGMVGIRDVLRAPHPSHSGTHILRWDSVEEKAGLLRTTTVDQVMRRKLVSVGEDEQLMEVAGLMANRGVHPILVLREGRLVGVIGRADVARELLHRADAAEPEADSAPGSLA